MPNQAPTQLPIPSLHKWVSRNHSTAQFRDNRFSCNVVFGSIAEIENTTVVIPINQDFDLLQRGPQSVLASFEKITVDGRPFFDSLEALWPEDIRPTNAGLGHNHFIP